MGSSCSSTKSINKNVEEPQTLKLSEEVVRKLVFVLGGPGSGKGTQCLKLKEKYGCAHYSTGDLLREEAKKETEEGKMITEYIRDVFLIDGFPREMKQAHEFEKEIGPCLFVLFFDCPEEILEERLLERGKTSGRTDDNIESIKKRFVTYQGQTMPVVEHYRKTDKVKTMDSSKTIDEVFEDTCKIFDTIV
ncbi:hypothetical protein ABK040_005677 [Willaertia magna]